MLTPGVQAAEPVEGQLDQEFVVGDGIMGQCEESPASVGALGQLSGGDVVVGGCFQEYQDEYADTMVRIKPDGSPARFNLGYNPTPREYPRDTRRMTYDRITNPGVGVIEVLENDRMLVGGIFRDYTFLKLINQRGRQVRDFRYQEPARGGEPQNYVNYGFNGEVSSIEKVGQDTFLIGGSFTTYSQRSVNKLGRFKLRDNVLVLDETFRSQLPADSNGSDGRPAKTRVYVTEVLQGGDILIGGRVTKYGRTKTSGLVHVDASGELLSTFAFEKDGKASYVSNIVSGYPSDNGVVVGGGFDKASGALASGLLLMSQQPGGGAWVTNESMTVQGPPDTFRQNFRLQDDRDGRLGKVTGLQLDTVGRLYVSGEFTFVIQNGEVHVRDKIVRLDRSVRVDSLWSPGGILDSTATGYFYYPDPRPADEDPEVQPPNVYEIWMLSDGDLLAGGRFKGIHNVVDGVGRNVMSQNLVRLSTGLQQDDGDQRGTSLQAQRPDLLSEKALTSKGFAELSGSIQGSLAPGEAVESRNFGVGFSSAEFGECQSIVFYPLPANLEVATATVQALGNPGDFLCAYQRLNTASGASTSSSTLYVPIVEG